MFHNNAQVFAIIIMQNRQKDKSGAAFRSPIGTLASPRVVPAPAPSCASGGWPLLQGLP